MVWVWRRVELKATWWVVPAVEVEVVVSFEHELPIYKGHTVYIEFGNSKCI